MNEQDFIKELKPMVRMGTSQWHDHDVHYMGTTILTSDEMRLMLSRFIDGFDKLSTTEQNKMRHRVFDALKEYE